MSGKFRNFVFTWNNYPQGYREIISGWIESGEMEFVACAEEVAPTTGTPHLQGYLKFKNSRTVGGVGKKYKFHVEPMAGSFAQNEAYCSKIGSLQKWGKEPEQGARNDIEDIKKAVKDGKSLQKIYDEGLMNNVQQIRFAEMSMKYARRYRGPRNILWLWGPTGSGKSKAAEDRCLEAGVDYQIIEFENGFCNGYTGAEYVIVNDFRGSDLKLSKLLNLLDVYPVTVNVKGGYYPWNAKDIVITSCYPPERCYKDTGENVMQLLRRITEVIRFSAGAEQEQKSGGNSEAEALNPPPTFAGLAAN